MNFELFCGRAAIKQLRGGQSFLFLIVFVCLAICPVRMVAAQGQLMAGTAKISMTPSRLDYPLHDSVFARSLVLDVEGQRLAFVAVDLVIFTSQRVVDVCKEKYGITQVLLSSSHTHSGPDRNTENTLLFENRIIEAIGLAVNNMFPAKISIGRKTFPQLGFNRLIVREDGHARESWFGDDHYNVENPERIPFGPVDPEVEVIKIDDMDGQARVIMMNYACHSDLMCFNYEISADYPGVATKKVEEAFGNKANCLFVQGAAGNIESLMISRRRTGPDDPIQSDYRPMERMGELLAFEVIKLARTMPSGNEKTDLRFRTDSLHFTGRYNQSLSYNVHLTTILINNDIVIAACPGELFVQLQLDWKAKIESASAIPVVFGYTWSGGDWQGYTPDIRSAALGGFGADQSMEMVEVGAGEVIMAKFLENFYVLNGLMRTQPPIWPSHVVK